MHFQCSFIYITISFCARFYQIQVIIFADLPAMLYIYSYSRSCSKKKKCSKKMHIFNVIIFMVKRISSFNILAFNFGVSRMKTFWKWRRFDAIVEKNNLTLLNLNACFIFKRYHFFIEKALKFYNFVNSFQYHLFKLKTFFLLNFSEKVLYLTIF